MKICVYCSSSDIGSIPYIEDAIELGHWIANQNHTLVYGGATGGLMDAVANAVHKEKGHIIGIIPTLIKEKGRISNICDELIEVADMGQRKNIMQEISDVFIVLPGGIGTIDELFDTLSKASLKYFEKKTILVNLNGYWDKLIEQLKIMSVSQLGHTSNLLITTKDIENTKSEIIKSINTINT